MTRLFIDVPAEAGVIPGTAERIACFGAGAGLDQQTCFQVQVVVAEALNNIVSHGLATAAAEAIHIHCEITEDGLEINIRDSGLPYDRLPSDRFPDAHAERGRGWPIIICWADSIEYRSTAGHNELTLRKTLS